MKRLLLLSYVILRLQSIGTGTANLLILMRELSENKVFTLPFSPKFSILVVAGE